MSQLDDFRRQLQLAKEREADADRQEAVAAGLSHEATAQKKMRKKKESAKPEASYFGRTSISLSRSTFARLDCYNFWLRRNAGRNYSSYSALLDAMLDEVLEADEKATSFVKRYSETF